MTDPVNAEDDLVEIVAKAMTAKRVELLTMRLGMGVAPGWDEYTDEGKADAIEEARAALEAVRSTRDSEIERYRAFEAVASEVLDEADNIIAVNCGTDTPKEWNRAFRKFARARQALNQGTDNVG